MCRAVTGFDGVVADPRDAGRYSLPHTTLAAVEAAGLLRTVSLGSTASVGRGGVDGGHLTSDGVLARQASAAAETIEAELGEASQSSSSSSSLHTGAQWAQASATGLKLFPSSVVGSLPRPEFIRELMLATQAAAEGEEGEGGDGGEVLRAAIKAAVAMQLQAGCDVVTDGELGRLSYIGIIAELGKKTHSYLLCHFYTKHDRFYQDRLGTNIGKALKKREVFSYSERLRDQPDG